MRIFVNWQKSLENILEVQCRFPTIQGTLQLLSGGKTGHLIGICDIRINNYYYYCYYYYHFIIINIIISSSSSSSSSSIIIIIIIIIFNLLLYTRCDFNSSSEAEYEEVADAVVEKRELLKKENAALPHQERACGAQSDPDGQAVYFQVMDDGMYEDPDQVLYVNQDMVRCQDTPQEDHAYEIPDYRPQTIELYEMPIRRI